MRFALETADGTEPIEITPRRLLIAGYTGRDQASVRAHVDEMAAHGVEAPSRIPSLFAAPASLVTTAHRIEVHGDRTSGEAEFILVRHAGALLVGVASDHTDRHLEEHSVIKAKQTCERPVGFTLWRVDDVVDHWDELILRGKAWGEVSSQEILYQEGTLAEMLAPDELLGDVEERVGALDEDVLFSGTLALLTGEFVCGPRFRAELIDPVLDRSLVCDYDVDVLPALDG